MDDRLNDLHADLTTRDQVNRIRQMADQLAEDGYTTKSEGMKEFADQLELWLPVIRAYEDLRSGDIADDRAALEDAIQRYE